MSAKLGPTPFQTVGPFFSMRLGRAGENVLVSADPRAEPIVLAGRVLDGRGAPIDDALLELWQADAQGVYDHPEDPRTEPRWERFTGFARAASGPDGRYRFETVKPGAVPDPGGGLQAPHVSLIVQARGVQRALFTRAYFSDEAAANARDRVLCCVPEARRATLVAARSGDGPRIEYRLDLRLQGDGETVFLDF